MSLHGRRCEQELAGLGASRDETVAEIEAAHEALCERLGVDEGRVKLEKGAPHGYHCRVSRKENMTHNSLVVIHKQF